MKTPKSQAIRLQNDLPSLAQPDHMVNVEIRLPTSERAKDMADSLNVAKIRRLIMSEAPLPPRAAQVDESSKALFNAKEMPRRINDGAELVTCQCSLEA